MNAKPQLQKLNRIPAMPTDKKDTHKSDFNYVRNNFLVPLLNYSLKPVMLSCEMWCNFLLIRSGSEIDSFWLYAYFVKCFRRDKLGNKQQFVSIMKLILSMDFYRNFHLKLPLRLDTIHGILETVRTQG